MCSEATHTLTDTLMPSPDSDRCVLPANGRVAWEQLAAALRNAPRELGLPDAASLRSVRYHASGQWHNLGTALVLGDEEPEAQDRIISGIRLLARQVHPSEITSGDVLDHLLTLWPDVDVEPAAARFDDTISVRRSSGDLQTATPPGWLLDLRVLRDEPRSGELPDGPFFDPRIDFFAEGFSSASRLWMPKARWDPSRSPRDDYRLIIPDRRALFQSVERDRKRISVMIEARTAGQLYCCAQINAFGGDDSVEIQPIANGQVIFASETSVRSFSSYLLDAESYTYDSAHHPRYNLLGRGSGVTAEDHDPSLERLEEDAAAGEGQTIEYKAWIPPKGEKSKWRELLDTVVGFANADGGRLYIGINDRGETVGVDLPLKKEYGGKHGDDVRAQRDDYSWELQHAIAKGIQPSLAPVFEWFEPAGRTVLCIAVEPGREVPYYVVESNEIFVRRGATTRRALPHELETLFANRPAHGRRSRG
jgi:hypothetical protein